MSEATYHRVVTTPHARGCWIVFPKENTIRGLESREPAISQKNLEEKPLTKIEKTPYVQ